MALSDWLPWNRNRASRIDLMRAGLPPEAKPAIPQGVSAQEFGASGTELFGGYIRKEDFNPDFDDFQRAVQIFEKMRRTDSQIRAMLQVIKLPLRGATWQCNPASADPVDKAIAEFVNRALFNDDAMEESWDYTLRHILLQLDFGFSVIEKVWKVDRDGYYRFKKLAPRLPKTIREWHTNREGKLVAIVQYAPVPTSTKRDATGIQRTPTYNTSMSYQNLTIPAEYAAVFSLEKEGDNYEGWSLLRTVYRNWWFKDQAYRTMGVGLDRWGVGIPVAQLEDGHGLTTTELGTLREVLQAVRSNERAYLIGPPHVTFKILPEGGGQGTVGQLGIAWIDHNDSQIAKNVLAGFLTMGQDTHGTLGFGSRLTDMFISSLNGIAAGICGDLKRQVVKQICDLNFDMTNRAYPDPVCLDLEQTDLESLLKHLAVLTGTAGVLTAQDSDEDILRKMLGLPKLDPANSRAKKAEIDDQKAKDAKAKEEAAAAVAAANPQLAAAEGQAKIAEAAADAAGAKAELAAAGVATGADVPPVVP